MNEQTGSTVTQSKSEYFTLKKGVKKAFMGITCNLLNCITLFVITK